MNVDVVVIVKNTHMCYSDNILLTIFTWWTSSYFWSCLG